MAGQINNSIVRSFAILGLFSEHRTEITSAVVVRELGLNAVTAHRFLKSLEHVGALVSIGRGVYRLGYRLFDLAGQVEAEPHLAMQLQPVLDDLAAAANESAMATRFDGRNVFCIATGLSKHAVAFNARVGARFETHATANGKLWLAELDDAALNRHLATVPRETFSGRTVVSTESLLAEIAVIRERGYAINDGEREPDLRAIAAPVRDTSGRMIAGISVFGPSSRFDRAACDAALPLLLEAVAQAGSRLAPRRSAG